MGSQSFRRTDDLRADIVSELEHGGKSKVVAMHMDEFADADDIVCIAYAAVEDPATGRVHGSVCLVSDMDGEQAINELHEDAGPCACECPRHILRLLSYTENEYANEWRYNAESVGRTVPASRRT